MTTERRQVRVHDGERTIAAADVQAVPADNAVRAELYVEPGELPPATRARLVEAVLDLPEAAPGHRLRATMRAGDGELLDAVRDRCDDVQARRAGSTTLVDATITEPPAASDAAKRDAAE